MLYTYEEIMKMTDEELKTADQTKLEESLEVICARQLYEIDELEAKELL